MVLCTFPDLGKARQIGTALVEKQLAACVNVLPGVASIYQWEGQTRQDEEVLALIKTGSGRFEALREEILRLHPYEVPEIIALPVKEGSEAYLSWVRRQTGGDEGP